MRIFDAAGTELEPLTKSLNFILKVVSLVGTVTWNVHFHPFSNVLSAVAKLRTVSMPVTASGAVPSASVITTAALATLVLPAASVEYAVNEFSVAWVRGAMNDHAVVSAGSEIEPTTVAPR